MLFLIHIIFPGLLRRDSNRDPRQVPNLQCPCSQLHMEVQWLQPKYDKNLGGEWSS